MTRGWPGSSTVQVATSSRPTTTARASTNTGASGIKHWPPHDRSDKAPLPDLTPADTRVRATLRIARERAGMSQPALARALGWSQTKVTRTETGGRQVGLADAEAWMRVTGASMEATAEVQRLIEDATVQAMTWGRLYEQ